MTNAAIDVLLARVKHLKERLAVNWHEQDDLSKRYDANQREAKEIGRQIDEIQAVVDQLTGVKREQPVSAA
jgi:hypothetical protein